jgi:hypothetical protein
VECPMEVQIRGDGIGLERSFGTLSGLYRNACFREGRVPALRERLQERYPLSSRGGEADEQTSRVQRSLWHFVPIGVAYVWR